MPANFKLNHSGVQQILDGDEGVAAILAQKAGRVLAAAQADPHDDTYAYQNGLHVEIDHTDRMVARVVSGDFKGHILEARYGILLRSLDAAR